MPTQDDLKNTLYQQQNMINDLSKATDPQSKKALEVMKPQYEQSLSLYTKALKKYKQPQN